MAALFHLVDADAASDGGVAVLDAGRKHEAAHARASAQGQPPCPGVTAGQGHETPAAPLMTFFNADSLLTDVLARPPARPEVSCVRNFWLRVEHRLFFGSPTRHLRQKILRLLLCRKRTARGRIGKKLNLHGRLLGNGTA